MRFDMQATVAGGPTCSESSITLFLGVPHKRPRRSMTTSIDTPVQLLEPCSSNQQRRCLNSRSGCTLSKRVRNRSSGIKWKGLWVSLVFCKRVLHFLDRPSSQSPLYLERTSVDKKTFLTPSRGSQGSVEDIFLRVFFFVLFASCGSYFCVFQVYSNHSFSIFSCRN